MLAHYLQCDRKCCQTKDTKGERERGEEAKRFKRDPRIYYCNHPKMRIYNGESVD